MGSERKPKLEKIQSGDYLMRSDDGRLWRIAKIEELGTGSRGMYGEWAWGVWKWLGSPGTHPTVDDLDDPWDLWDYQGTSYGARGEAIDAVIKGASDAR